MKDVVILGIESSCDETSAAIVINGRQVLSNIIASQVQLHAEYGGVVPEIASRKHVEAIIPVIDKACKSAGVAPQEVDAVAVTYGPGLVGALLVGVSAAKALAFALEKPLVGVNHIEGHICANYIAFPELTPPYICLVASGGHSHVVHVKSYGACDVLGRTRDDAAGEAFDKVARILGLGYPGGPAIEKKAITGNPEAFSFPRVNFKEGFDFSFSGLKTAVINRVHQFTQKGEPIPAEDISASFQKAAVEVLVHHTLSAAVEKSLNKVCLAGGVAANGDLRESMKEMGGRQNIEVYYPPLHLCTDNAAMIASAGYFAFKEGKYSGLDLNAVPGLKLQ